MKRVVAAILVVFSALRGGAAVSERERDVAAEKTGMVRYEAATSPSRKFVSLSGIGLSEVSPSFRGRLRILIVDLVATDLEEIRPMVTGEWAVTWSPANVLLVCGVPEGEWIEKSEEPPAHVIYAYAIAHDRKPKERVPTEEEKAIIRQVFGKKYGHRPTA